MSEEEVVTHDLMSDEAAAEVIEHFRGTRPDIAEYLERIQAGDTFTASEVSAWGLIMGDMAMSLGLTVQPIGISHMVQEFHDKFNLPYSLGKITDDVDPDAEALRIKLVYEEFDELMEAIDNGNLPDILHEAADLVYVVAGLTILYGANIEAVVEKIHEANMTKPVEYDEDGKVVKGSDDSGFVPADIKKFIVEEGGFVSTRFP